MRRSKPSAEAGYSWWILVMRNLAKDRAIMHWIAGKPVLLEACKDMIAVVPMMWHAEHEEKFDVHFPGWRKELKALEKKLFAAEIALAEKQHPDFKRWRAEHGDEDEEL